MFPSSASGCWGRTKSLILLSSRAGQAELPGAPGPQAAAGDYKDSSSLQWPAGKRHQRGQCSTQMPAWPHGQGPMISISVVSSPVSHSQHHCGLVSNDPQPAPVWPYGQRGFIPSVPRPAPLWPCVQCPTANTSVALQPAWFRPQHPTADTNVVLGPVVSQQRPVWPHTRHSCRRSHGQHQRGLVSSVLWPTPACFHPQCCTASTTVASCPMSHSQCQCGLMPDVPQPSPSRSHVQHPMKMPVWPRV